MNVYETCPSYLSNHFQLRFVQKEDCADLLRVYSDKKAVPFFNSDNCHGDDFHYTTMERMAQAIDFWLYSYENGCFVRWSVIDKQRNMAIGTIELFTRGQDDFYNGNHGVLRLDLRSDYETADSISEILSLIINDAFDLFNCDMITTKAVPQAEERICAFGKIGFIPSDKLLTGHDGTKYGDYYNLYK